MYVVQKLYLNLLTYYQEEFLSIEYSCIKRCQVYTSPASIDLANILQCHYESTLISEKLCCMENCQFVATSISSMISHFETCHDKDLEFVTENFVLKLDIDSDLKKSYQIKYVLQYDIFVEILLTFNIVHQKYSISATICDKDEKNKNLLMHVYVQKFSRKREFLGTFFNKQILLDTYLKQVHIRFVIL